MTTSPNPPDTIPLSGQSIQSAFTKTGLRQSTMENCITTNCYLPLIEKEKTMSMMSPEDSKGYTCETDLQNPVIYVHSPSSPEDTLPPVQSVKTTANLNGLATRPTSIIQSDMLHKSPHNLIASVMDWPKKTSKMT